MNKSCGINGSPLGTRKRNMQVDNLSNSLPGSRRSSPGQSVMSKRVVFEEDNTKTTPICKTEQVLFSNESSTYKDSEEIKEVEEFNRVFSLYNYPYRSNNQHGTTKLCAEEFSKVSEKDGKRYHFPQKTDNMKKAHISEGPKKKFGTLEGVERSTNIRIIPDYVNVVLQQPAELQTDQLLRERKEKGKPDQSYRKMDESSHILPNQFDNNPSTSYSDEAQAVTVKNIKQYLPTYIQPMPVASNVRGYSASDVDPYSQTKRDELLNDRANTTTYKDLSANEVREETRNRMASSHDSSIKSKMAKENEKETIDNLRSKRLITSENEADRQFLCLKSNFYSQITKRQTIQQTAKSRDIVCLPAVENAQPTTATNRRLRRQRFKQKSIEITEEKYSTVPANFSPAEVSNLLINEKSRSVNTPVKDTLLNNNCNQNRLLIQNELMIANVQTSPLQDTEKKTFDVTGDIANISVHTQSIQTNQSSDKTGVRLNNKGTCAPDKKHSLQSRQNQAEIFSKFSSNQPPIEFGLVYNKPKTKSSSTAASDRIKDSPKLETGNVAHSQPMLKAIKLSEDYWPRDEATVKLLSRNSRTSTEPSTVVPITELSNSMSQSSCGDSERHTFSNVHLLQSSKETNLSDPVDLKVDNVVHVKEDVKASLMFQGNLKFHKKSQPKNENNNDYKNSNYAVLTSNRLDLSDWQLDDPDSKLQAFVDRYNEDKNVMLAENDEEIVKNNVSIVSNKDGLPMLDDIKLQGEPLHVAKKYNEISDFALIPKQVNDDLVFSNNNSVDESNIILPQRSPLASTGSIKSLSISERKNSIVCESTALPKIVDTAPGSRKSVESVDEGCFVDEVSDRALAIAKFEEISESHKNKERIEANIWRRRRKGSAAAGQNGSDCSNGSENCNRFFSDPTSKCKKSVNVEEREPIGALDSNFQFSLKTKENSYEGKDMYNMSECSDPDSIRSSCLNESQNTLYEPDKYDVDIDVKSLKIHKKKSLSDPNSTAVKTAGLLSNQYKIIGIQTKSSSSSDPNLTENAVTNENLQSHYLHNKIKGDIGSSTDWLSQESSSGDIGDANLANFSQQGISPNRQPVSSANKMFSQKQHPLETLSDVKIDTYFEPIQDQETYLIASKLDYENSLAIEEAHFNQIFNILQHSENSSSSINTVVHDRSASEPITMESNIVRKVSEKGRRPGIVEAPSISDVLLSEESMKETLKVPRAGIVSIDYLQKEKFELRLHVLDDLLQAERSYVKSLTILKENYLEPLKRPEGYNLLGDPFLADEMFCQVPEIHRQHKKFYANVKECYFNWNSNCKIGELFLKSFDLDMLLETYTKYIKNYTNAREVISNTCETRPAFKDFLEQCQREDKSKHRLPDLMIQPVQRMPRYELIIKALLKHTPEGHPDHESLLIAKKEIHSLVLQMNDAKNTLEAADRNTKILHDIEEAIEGCADISGSFKRRFLQQYFCYELKSGNKKERSLWLFNDLLISTTAKRRNQALRRSSINNLPSISQDQPLFDTSWKYKFLWKRHLKDIELQGDAISNIHSEKEIQKLQADQEYLFQIDELVRKLNLPHADLDKIILRYQEQVDESLKEKQQQEQYAYQSLSSSSGRLEIVLSSASEAPKIVVYDLPEQDKTNFAQMFRERKNSLTDKHQPGSMSPLSGSNRNSWDAFFLKPIPITKTRNGMQFSCATPCSDTSIGNKEVWICNTDGYVGQVCLLSLDPEPKQSEPMIVCYSKIWCIALVPSWDRKYVPAATMINGLVSAPLNISSRRPSSNSLAKTIMAFDDVSDDTDEDNTSPISTINTTSPYNTFNNNSPYSTYNSGCNHDYGDDNGGFVEGGGAYKKGNDGLTHYGSLGDLLNDASSESKDLIAGSQALGNKASMWIGTDDGKINIYTSTEALHNNSYLLQLHHSSAVQCILSHLDQVFVALTNGELIIYSRDHNNGGHWNFTKKKTIEGASSNNPITKMLVVNDRELWCGRQNQIQILDVNSHNPKSFFPVSSDSKRQICCMACCGFGVWIALDKKPIIKLYNSITHELITEVNVCHSVNKMLSSCDAIIRQHKEACLRITALLVCKSLLWIGTSAGVVLNLTLPTITETSTHLPIPIQPQGLSYGHTGHVRFLTSVDVADKNPQSRGSRRSSISRRSSSTRTSSLVISGGDGYEDFLMNSASEAAGREDSTNHLLVWKV